MKKIDLKGQRFGRLLVLEEGNRGRTGLIRWVCICDCGKQNTVVTSHLRNSVVQSCGCLAKEVLLKRTIKHGYYGTPEYRAWRAMLDRCYNKNVDSYEHYGGRGIIVCERWRISFENFIKDVGNRPSSIHSLDRYPNMNGNYEPSNFRWALVGEQNRNKRNNVWINYNGTNMILSDWANKLGFKIDTLWRRLNNGWSIEKALTTPIK